MCHLHSMFLLFSLVDESRETNDNTKTWTVDTAALSQKKSLSDSLPSTPDDSGYATTSGLQPGSNSYISGMSDCTLTINLVKILLYSNPGKEDSCLLNFFYSCHYYIFSSTLLYAKILIS